MTNYSSLWPCLCNRRGRVRSPIKYADVWRPRVPPPSAVPRPKAILSETNERTIECYWHVNGRDSFFFFFFAGKTKNEKRKTRTRMREAFETDILLSYLLSFWRVKRHKRSHATSMQRSKRYLDEHICIYVVHVPSPQQVVLLRMLCFLTGTLGPETHFEEFYTRRWKMGLWIARYL